MNKDEIKKIAKEELIEALSLRIDSMEDVECFAESHAEKIADKIQPVHQCGHFIDGKCNREEIAGVGKVSRQNARDILLEMVKRCEHVDNALDRLGFGEQPAPCPKCGGSGYVTTIKENYACSIECDCKAGNNKKGKE